MQHEKPRIAVINGLPDTLELLEFVLRDAGYDTVAAQARDVRLGIVDLPALARNHRLAAIVYDVAIPYEDNWRYLTTLRERAGDLPPIVVTTTNLLALERLVGVRTAAIELVGKPFDLDTLVRAVDVAANRPRVSPQRHAGSS